MSKQIAAIYEGGVLRPLEPPDLAEGEELDVVLLPRPIIQIESFRFTMRLPIQAGVTHTEGSAAGYPIIQYQDSGITTQLSVREGVPTSVGTLIANQPHESYVLVLTVKRTAAR